MYFEIIAFDGLKRVKENLDSINECNEFLNKMIAKSFEEFEIKSFDCNGLRKHKHCVYDYETENLIKYEVAI